MACTRLRTIFLLCGAAVAGCAPPPPPMAPPRLPDVEVAEAVEDTITDYEVFYGKSQAEKEVDVRARVSGYLDKIHFKDGAEVHEKDVLFEIDPRPLQAELDRAEANVAQAEAHLQRMEYDYRRAESLAHTKSMSREEYDKAFGDMGEARSAVKAAVAARNTAKLNLEYSRVTAPISGRISRRMIDAGNLIKADDTSLTRIVSLDPIYAYFDIDERTYGRVKHFLEQQEYSPGQWKRIPVAMGLSDENASGEPTEGRGTFDDDHFPFRGEIDFVDNRIDPDSGSLWVRATFANAQRRLTPGLFVRVRLPLGLPHRTVLIPEQALATDQGQKFVWVVEKKTVEGAEQYQATYRQLKFGAQHGRQRVIEKGIAPGEQVIVSGLQRVRPDPKTGYALVNVLAPKKG
jgi:multidrug efflux system membrane fusion protein